jgi:prolipoprotein diacylglyceryltransferase
MEKQRKTPYRIDGIAGVFPLSMACGRIGNVLKEGCKKAVN